MAIKISGSTIIDDSRNIVAGAAATFTGSVSVGGTLTYEDVTNIDSVGLITARNGIDIKGNSTFTGNVFDFADGKKLRFGTGNDLEMHFNGTDSYINATAGKIILRVNDGEEGIHINPNNSVDG